MRHGTRYRRRNIYSHNPQATLVRANVRDNQMLGRIIADKLNQSHGPVIVIWPEKGLSTLDRPGRPYRDPRADAALLRSLKKHLDRPIPLIEIDSHINDPEFAQVVFQEFDEMTR
jgi:uncharacterized protein (UPF0261 family)